MYLIIVVRLTMMQLEVWVEDLLGYGWNGHG